MAVSLDEIRLAAQRVATSHGLDVVDIEFIGPSKERTLRVYLEKNAEGRAKLKASLAAAAEEAMQSFCRSAFAREHSLLNSFQA